MPKPVSLGFVQGLLSKCPAQHRLVVMMRGGLYEVDRVEHGALVVRPAQNFKLGKDELKETEVREITGYWYLEE